ncbi:MAG: hypothetical protein CMJ64_01390 [Planctomycetaceae bacterium]|nr:hypothetical protein [Planctomycetaceae bacterium]
MRILFAVVGLLALFVSCACGGDDTPSRESIEREIDHTTNLVKAARELREKFQNDPHRPTWHFLAPDGVCFPFDPQGCVFWKGKYHLFYAIQVKGKGAWGHASSVDLVHWVHHPVPLTVNAGDPETAVFAGGAFIDKNGVPTMIYHGLDIGTCIATPTDDDLIHWKKSPHNPVIRLPKKGDKDYGRYHVWDTCGWVKAGMYYSICGDKPNTLPETDGDIAFLFRSKDLVNWEYLHPFYKSDRKWTPADEDCSCPDFFPLGNKHVLMFISHTQGTQYYIGRFQNDRFHPERHGKMNWPGGPVFANDSLVDNKGRRIMWAWACESWERDTQRAAGWSGVMTLPRVLSLADDGTMQINPVKELHALRLNPRSTDAFAVPAGSDLTLDDVSGDSLELSLQVDLRQAKEFGVKVRCSPDDAEGTVITVKRDAGLLTINTTKSSLRDDIIQPFPYPQAAYFPKKIRQSKDIRIQEAPFKLASRETLELRIFLDRSILEVFANGRQCMTQRIYPLRKDSRGVKLFSTGGAVTVKSLHSWDMARANAW